MDGLVAVSSAPSQNLQRNQGSKNSHGREQRTLRNAYFPNLDLCYEPQDKKRRTGRFKNKNCPRLNSTESQWSKSQNPKQSIKCNLIENRGRCAARCSAADVWF